MNRLEKCIYAYNAGYTYNEKTGDFFNKSGRKITAKNSKGYRMIGGKNIPGGLLLHHYAWFMIYGNVDFEMLDHINRDKTDNRISNLRIVNNQKNAENTNAKGFSWDKRAKKWKSRIIVNGKYIYLGLYETEEEARNAYLQSKKIYHKK